jgi:hypothetical protein
VASLLSSLTIEDATGTQIALLAPGTRQVSKADGIQGVRVRELVVPRVGRHGSRARTRLRDDRVITLEGHCLGSTDDQVWQEYHAISRALGDAVDTDRVLRWTLGSGLALYSRVRLTELVPAFEVGPRMLAYQAHLRAPDPRAYSQSTVVVIPVPVAGTTTPGLKYPYAYPSRFQVAAGGGTSLAMTNLGTAPTPLVIQLTGYMLDPTVQFGDRQLVFSGTIATGDTLTISNVERPRVILNGTANRISMLVSERSRWFDLPPGRSSSMQLIARDVGAGSIISAQFQHAYS